MAKPEWGSKRVCQSCGGRFYDLLRDPITCPHCGAELQATAHQRGRRNRPAAGGAQPATAARGSGGNLENGDPLAEVIVDEVDLDDEEVIDDNSGSNKLPDEV